MAPSFKIKYEVYTSCIPIVLVLVDPKTDIDTSKQVLVLESTQSKVFMLILRKTGFRTPQAYTNVFASAAELVWY